MNFLEDIFAQLAAAGDKTVLRELHDPGVRQQVSCGRTGGGLLKQVAQARAFLATKGLKKGDRCALLAHHLEKRKNEELLSVRRAGTFLWYLANTTAVEELLRFLYAVCWRRNKAIEPQHIIRRTLMSTTSENVKDVIKEKYGQAALRVKTDGSSCCGATPSCGTDVDPITSNLYDASQKHALPEEAVLASLGCGNPTSLAQLNPGETVLDLGSGGGIDVLLSAKRVGPTGKVYGLDMTDEMLALARENQRKAGADNVEFLRGEIEQIPLPDNSVDVIISNCVINLSADKERVFKEAFRVLKPGGRFAVSDVVTRGEMLPEIRERVLLWVGCIAGALEENDYRAKLTAAGFESVDLEPTRIYRIDDARAFLSGQGIDVDAIAPQVDGKFMSAFVRATKPAGACCAPACCP